MNELIIKNNDIQLVKAKEARIDSRIVAKEMGIKHKNLYELITKHKTLLRGFGSLATFETEEVKKQGNRGIKHQRYYLLNESQFDLISRLARGKNHKQIIDFKIRVTKAFSNIRKREYLPNYHNSRDSLATMDGVKKHHYINLAKAENKIIGLSTGERQNADDIQLGMLICLQQISANVFNDIRNPTEAIREVNKRFNQLSNIIAPVKQVA